MSRLLAATHRQLSVVGLQVVRNKVNFLKMFDTHPSEGALVYKQSGLPDSVNRCVVPRIKSHLSTLCIRSPATSL